MARVEALAQSRATLYLESIRQQKNSRFSLVAEIANISLANQVTQKSTSEFKTSEKIGSCHISSDYSLSFFGNKRRALLCSPFFVVHYIVCITKSCR